MIKALGVRWVPTFFIWRSFSTFFRWKNQGAKKNVRKFKSLCLRSGGVCLPQAIPIFMRRIFFFSENLKNSRTDQSQFDSSSTQSQFDPSPTGIARDQFQSTTTISNSSLQWSADSPSDGLFGPGQDPSSSERLVERHSDLTEELRQLMPNKSEQEVLIAAEALHAESDNMTWMLITSKGNEITSSTFFDLLNLCRSPLEQFAIHPLIPFQIGNFYFSFTNSSLSMLLTLGLVLLLILVVTKKGGGKLVPNAWQSLVELIYDFVLNLVNEQIGGLSGNVKQKFFPRISVTLTFSLFRNPQGMIPFSFTVTSHFLITLALSFSLFIGITIVGFQRHGLHFFSFFLPAGVPLPLAPFLVLLELISYSFRALSLGIRLFANMMAGHSLVKIISGFAWTMLFLNNIFFLIGDLGPLLLVLALTGLELGVAISQAHVSTISICIYLNDATFLHQNESIENKLQKNE
nr:ATP synthase F0 subunit 6 [Xyris pauciflora]